MIDSAPVVITFTGRIWQEEMKKQNSLFAYVLVFTLAQISWFFLLGLWIYWYVTNYLILNLVEEKITTEVVGGGANVFALVSGLILLVMISIGMSLIFIYLTKQMNITRLYDNFIANITHELKSPLASIQLYLETMRKRQIPDKVRNEFVAAMLEDADRLNKLITSILDISALEQKRIAYNFQVYEVDAIIKELIDYAIFQFKIDPKNVSFEGSAGCQSVIDRGAFQIVINNLFDNALKYSKSKFQLQVQLSRNPKNVLIKITDYGMGIPLNEQKNIFQKFYRIQSAAMPSVKGSGLGLYWVREIIRSHGGRISLYSAGESQGTAFTIELPIYKTSKKSYIKRLLKYSHQTKKQLDAMHEPVK